MEKHFKIPTGIYNFTDFSKHELFYVDKTVLIASVINDPNKITWFLYPRGFGKTVNLNMIYNFFDVNHMFPLKSYYNINKEPGMIALRNKIPVIYLNFTDTESISLNGFFHNFKKVIRCALNYYPFIFSDRNDNLMGRSFFQNVYDGYCQDQDYVKAIRVLIDKIAKYYQLKVIIIIDGYDELFLKAIACHYFEEFKTFFNQFLDLTITDNEDIHKVIMGGIFPFKLSIKDVPVFVTNADPYSETIPLGFTQNEASQMIINIGDEEPMGIIRQSMGAYNVGRTVICPKVIVDVMRKEIPPINFDYLLDLIIALNHPSINETLVKLARGERVPLGEKYKVIYLEDIAFSLRNNFLSALVNYGHACLVQGKDDSRRYEVIIANEYTRLRVAGYLTKKGVLPDEN